MEKVEKYRLENQKKNEKKMSKIKESAEYTLNKQKKLLVDEANLKVSKINADIEKLEVQLNKDSSLLENFTFHLEKILENCANHSSETSRLKDKLRVLKS